MSRNQHALRVAAFFAIAFGTVLIPFVIAGVLSLIYGAPPYIVNDRTLARAFAGEIDAFGREAIAAEPAAAPTSSITRAMGADFRDGTQVVLLQPTNGGSAGRAAAAFAETVNATRSSTMSTTHGTVRRLWTEDGRHIRIFDVGPVALAVKGADQDAVRERVDALPFLIPNPEGRAFLDTVQRLLPYLIVGFLIYLALLGPLWLRIASRLLTIPGAERADRPVDENALRDRLAALERPDLPFKLTVGKRPDELVVSWNTLDAAWIGPLFHTGRRRRIDRMRLRFDPKEQIVRSVDTTVDAEFSGEATPGNVTLYGSFSFFRGIAFDAIEIGAIPGIVWEGEDPRAEPGYVWRFDLSELKRAVARVITDAGWNFRPVATFSRALNG